MVLSKKIYLETFKKKLREINRKVIVPSREEIKINSRARSAKLRIAEYNG